MFDNLVCTQVGTLTVVRLDLEEPTTDGYACLMVFFNEGEGIFEASRVNEKRVYSTNTTF